MIELVYLHLVHAQIHRAQIVLIRRDIHAVYMRAEIPLRHAAQSFVKDLVCHLSDGAVFIQPHHGHLSVMPACHKQELIFLVRGKITASHTKDRRAVHRFQIPIRKNLKGSDAFIRDGIKIFAIMRLFDIRRIVDRYDLSLLDTAVLHVQVIDIDAFAVPVSIGPYVCHIFFLIHVRLFLPYGGCFVCPPIAIKSLTYFCYFVNSI